MNTLTKSAPLGTLGLSSGDHWVHFHVEGDSLSYVVAASVPEITASAAASRGPRKPTGFVKKWGGSARKIEDAADTWLTHINDKHLR